jgi:hypothetical protein
MPQSVGRVLVPPSMNLAHFEGYCVRIESATPTHVFDAEGRLDLGTHRALMSRSAPTALPCQASGSRKLRRPLKNGFGGLESTTGGRLATAPIGGDRVY